MKDLIILILFFLVVSVIAHANRRLEQKEETIQTYIQKVDSLEIFIAVVCRPQPLISHAFKLECYIVPDTTKEG